MSDLREDQLLADIRNPRKISEGALDGLRASLKTFGDLSSIVFNLQTRELVSGHQRMKGLRIEAARRGVELHIEGEGDRRWIVLPQGSAEGEDREVWPLRIVDKPRNWQMAANLTANNEAIQGTFTDDVEQLLREIGEAMPVEFQQLRLDVLAGDLGIDLNAVQDPEDRRRPEPKESAGVELALKWQTRLGQIWQIGPHRLAIGSSSNRALVARLFGKALADAVWSDPPYGVNYVGRTASQLEIESDSPAGLADLLFGAFQAADEHLKPGAAIYISHPGGANAPIFYAAFLEQGWRLHQTLVWVKDRMVIGHSDYHHQHEPVTLSEKPDGPPREKPGRIDGSSLQEIVRHKEILFGYETSAPGRRGRGGAGWYGDNCETTVFEVDRPSRNADHPTSKPPELIERHLNNSCPAGGLVFDPFFGSGSTMVAAQVTGRIAYGVELDLRYAAVTIQRGVDMGLEVRLTEEGLDGS